MSVRLLQKDAEFESAYAEFAGFIKLIGRGKKAGEYLTFSQAERAMTLLLTQRVLPEQQGAFLMLLRMREESVEELAGFLSACRQTLPNVTNAEASLPQADIDIGLYAGKRRHLPWHILAALLLVKRGYRVFMHGTQEPGSGRLYLDNVWRRFGWHVANSAQHARELMELNGFCYMNLADVHEQMHHHIQLRELFGLRSCMNSLARMLNPSSARVNLQGVYHKHFDERHISVAKRLNNDNVACFRGDGGEVEVNPERPFTLHIHNQGQIQQLHFPALLESWQVKPKSLDVSTMISCWCGNADNLYGQQAVVGTLATMLCLLESLTAEAAIALASEIWLNRDRQWPGYRVN
ncbi:glycosyl transferase family protein [Alteromonas flava]|uniref:glycosyl transferase family protein n=1 Tax=Alteromonas flava TaxID=2048003 RepID=UPI000C284B35|nr:glycosyl transferase family protein [Alteromonas flava]